MDEIAHFKYWCQFRQVFDGLWHNLCTQHPNNAWFCFKEWKDGAVFFGLLGIVGGLVWLVTLVASGFNVVVVSLGLLAMLYVTGKS